MCRYDNQGSVWRCGHPDMPRTVGINRLTECLDSQLGRPCPEAWFANPYPFRHTVDCPSCVTAPALPVEPATPERQKAAMKRYEMWRKWGWRLLWGWC